MAHVNLLKQIKVDDRWKIVAIPRTKKGSYDWDSLPPGRYYLDFYERGKRKRQAAGSTAAEALEAMRRKKHALEGRALGVESAVEEDANRQLAHIAAKKYRKSIEAQKKPTTHRKYKAVIDRFIDFLPANADPRKIARDDLVDFMVRLKNKHKLDNNTV